MTALGAAALAGLGAGLWTHRSELEAAAGPRTLFEPSIPEAEREALYRGWKRAVERSRDWATD